MWRNTRSGWGIISIALHWLSALAFIGLFVLGWWMTGLDYYHDWYYLGPWWHRSAGMLLLFATLARLAWRLVNPAPAGLGHRLERIAAHIGHIALYALMLVVLVTGYLIPTAKGDAVSVFGWFEVPALISDLPDQATLAGVIHWYGSLLLILLAAGHTLAALKHHFIDRNATLRRMIDPSRSRR